MAYVQHTPMEPRAADGRVAGRQADRLGRHRLARSGSRAIWRAPSARRASSVRVIVPDMGGGFGGQAHRRGGGGGGAPRPRGRASGRRALDPRGGVHLGLFPPRRGDRVPGGPRRRRRAHRLGFHQHQRRAARRSTRPTAIRRTRHRVRRLRLAAAPGRLPLPGGDGQQLRARVVHGRAGRGRRARPARFPPGPPGERADPRRCWRSRPRRSTGPTRKADEHGGRRASAWPAARRRTPSSPPASR